MSLTQLLGIDVPIIQAPMAGAQGSALAIAVSKTGALGSLPCAMLNADALRAELTTIRALTKQPFNVNFFCHTQPAIDIEKEQAWRAMLTRYFIEYDLDADTVVPGPARLPFNEEAAAVLAEFQPAAVSFHFGLPSDALLAKVRSWDAKIISTATTVAEAVWLEQHGADAVIAQGWEAGGHRGNFLSDELLSGSVGNQLSTLALVPQIVDAVKIPVIAAGGIADARGINAAMRLGAAGVQIGTAYLLCNEATISDVYRRALKSESARSTAVTNVFTGRPARGIVNRMIKEMGPINFAAPAFPLANSAITPLRVKAEAQGSGDFSPLWAGQNVSGCREISAAELTYEFARGVSI
jgi:nitronate monooxygenase